MNILFVWNSSTISGVSWLSPPSAECCEAQCMADNKPTASSVRISRHRKHPWLDAEMTQLDDIHWSRSYALQTSPFEAELVEKFSDSANEMVAATRRLRWPWFSWISWYIAHQRVQRCLDRHPLQRSFPSRPWFQFSCFRSEEFFGGLSELSCGPSPVLSLGSRPSCHFRLGSLLQRSGRSRSVQECRPSSIMTVWVSRPLYTWSSELFVTTGSPLGWELTGRTGLHDNWVPSWITL